MLNTSLLPRFAIVSSPIAAVLATTVCATLPQATAIPMRLAWKTASRWSDVSRLASDSIRQVSPEEVILYFGSETKVSRQNLFTPDLFAVMRRTSTAEMAVFLQFRKNVAGKGFPLFPMSTDAVTDVLRPHGFGAHGLKRGAIEHFFQVLSIGDPRMALIALLTKHGPTCGPLRDLKIRYVTDQTAMAQHFGTGLLTSLL